MDLPLYTPFGEEELALLAAEIDASGMTVAAALVRLAGREGARVRLGSCAVCFYVFIDGPISDPLRVALTMAATRDTSSPWRKDRGVYAFRPAPSMTPAGQAHHCEGETFWTIVWD